MFFGQKLSAQTEVSGEVVDDIGNPLPFVNVYFKDSQEGSFTDGNGKFILKSNHQYRYLLISSIGFESRTITLKKPIITGLRIVMSEGEQLQEVIVVAPPKKRLKKKENPAYPIMKRVWEHIGTNGLNKTESYEYEKYTSIETGINNIDSMFIKNILGKNADYDKIIKLIKNNNGKENKLYVPLNIDEQIRKVYGNNILNKERIDIKAERHGGVPTQGFIFNRASRLFETVDIYKNSFQLFAASFVSPISKAGFATYDYVLHDSTIVGQKKKYNIYFFPRRSSDMAFEGYFQVEKPSYAVSKISMKLNKTNSINLVRSLFIETKYNIVNDSVFPPAESTYDIDYTLLSKSDKERAMYIRKTEVYENYLFDRPKKESFYDSVSPKVSDQQFLKSNKYWQSITIDDANTGRIAYMSKVKDNKKVRRTAKLLDFITTGYTPIYKNIQFGRYWDAFSYNNIEGLRLQLGFRTFHTIEDQFSSTFYTAYGTKDYRFKYGINTRYLLSTYPRLIVNLKIVEDFSQLSNRLLSLDQTLLNRPFFQPFLLARGNNFFLTNIAHKSIGANIEFAKNAHLGAIVSNERLKAASPENFNIDFDKGNGIKNSFEVTKLETYFLWTPTRKALGLGVIQRFFRNEYPSIMLRYVKSDRNLFSDLNFDKIQLLYNHPLLLGALGVFDPTIRLGKTFGTVPVTSLDAIPSTQALAVNSHSFSLLNYYSFVTDAYAMFTAEQRFNGFLMNRIPGINKLKLRILLFVKAAYGSISQENLDANKGEIIYNTPSEKPYVEYGFGIYNIGFGNLRFFRIDFVWRGDLPKGYSQSEKSGDVPNFGIRLGLIPKF